MTQFSGVAVLRAGVVVSAVLLGSCEAASFPDSPDAEALGTQGAELQATSSYLDLRLRTGGAAALGNTCGAANEVSSTCGNSGAAPDYNFKWTAPHSGNFSFTTQGSGFDTVLQLSQWGNGVSLGCNDNSGGTPQSAYTVYLPAGTNIRITVDGAGGKCGEFQLNITGEQAHCGTGYCSAPPGSCREGFGTCSAGTCAYALRPTGSACNDGNACTQSDTCNASGVCQGTAVVCNSPPGSCYQAAGVCSNGSCFYAARPAGTSCAGGCTLEGYCDGAGACDAVSTSCCDNGYIECGLGCCNPDTEWCYHGECRLIGPATERPDSQGTTH